MTGKPLVVMVGWLGCQPRFLRRYVSLYEKLGMDVLPVIASPLAVVSATFSSYDWPGSPDWPVKATTFKQHISPIEDPSTSMEHVARHVLHEIQRKRADSVVFHVFSNGGCFLWERVRRLMDDSSSSAENSFCPSSQTFNDANPSTSIKGVVFDSCPAWFGHDENVLATALQHCTEEEKKSVIDRFGQGIFDGEDEGQREQRQNRNQEFFEFLRDDHLDIPQLYLYCKNDPLSDHERIKEVFRFRTIHSRGPILQTLWSDSVHCAHLQKHPTEYAESVANFTGIIFRKSRL